MNKDCVHSQYKELMTHDSHTHFVQHYKGEIESTRAQEDDVGGL